MILLYDVKARVWLYENGELYIYACNKRGRSSKRAWCADRKAGKGPLLPNGPRSTAIHEVARQDGGFKCLHVYGAAGPQELPMPASKAAGGADRGKVAARGRKTGAKELEPGGAVLQPAEISNLFVRFLLASASPLTKKQWRETLDHFGHRCAYCGVPLGETSGKDHAVPINKASIGEHSAGNVVPCCKKCNRRKHSKGYREFLSNEPERIRRIEDLMAKSGYRPLKGSPVADTVRVLLEEAYEEVKQMARRHQKILRAVVDGVDRP